MTTTAVARPAADVLCGCRHFDHDPVCPANPDPTLCEGCGEAYDPDDTAPQADSCERHHCDTCREDCPSCTRPGCRAD